MSDEKTTQANMDLGTTTGGVDSVEKYQFAPIKGYPMLNWRGKRPFTSTQYYPAQLKEVHGEEVDGWRNKIFWGDNLQVMSHLLKQFRGALDFIYIDPPFSSKADYKKSIRLAGKAAQNSSTSFEEKQYSDIWTNDEYLQFIYERIVLMKELLRDGGIAAIHCDFNKVHHIRCIMDEIFGANNFVNDVTWYYENKPQFGFMKHLPRDHDYILVYGNGEQGITVNHQQVPVKKVQQQAVVAWDPVLKKRIAKRDADGNIIYETREEKYMGSVWTLPLVHPIAKERTGYPTQKPETLLERILKVYSNEGDLILDCFCGSGTTLNVARRLNRKFIGADINVGAIQTTVKRLLGKVDEHGLALEEQSKLHGAGFELFNVNNYDIFRNPVQAKELLVEALAAQPLEMNTVFDGEKDGRKDGELVIERFYPMNLLQKLSMQKEAVDDWRELTESILIDWNYDGAVLQPAVVDIPEKKTDLVVGRYKVPADAGTIRVKITDLLSESWEGNVTNG